MAANAQSSFTQRLQKSNAGEGKVTVTQDKAIDDLVNGTSDKKSQTTPQKQTERKESNNTTTATNQNQKEQDKKPDAKAIENQPNVVVVGDSVDTRKKVMKGYKVNGYRVQVFAGGNSPTIVSRLREQVAKSSRFSLEPPSTYISTLQDGSVVWVTIAPMRKPSRCSLE